MCADVHVQMHLCICVCVCVCVCVVCVCVCACVCACVYSCVHEGGRLKKKLDLTTSKKGFEVYVCQTVVL